jgi:hypothetical protein
MAGDHGLVAEVHSSAMCRNIVLLALASSVIRLERKPSSHDRMWNVACIKRNRGGTWHMY